MGEFLQHKEHAYKDENGSDDIEDGDLFIKNQPGKDGGNYRIKVHIIRCYDSSQPLYSSGGSFIKFCVFQIVSNSVW